MYNKGDSLALLTVEDDIPGRGGSLTIMYNKGDSLALFAVEDDIPGGCVIAKILPQIPKKKNWQGPERNRSQSKQFFSLFNVNLAVIPLQFPNKWKRWICSVYSSSMF